MEYINKKENKDKEILKVEEPQEAYENYTYTYEEAEKFVNGEYRYELIDGEIYAMASPSRKHQDIVGEIFTQFKMYFRNKKCRPFISPFDVILDSDSRNTAQIIVQPDVMVVCNEKYLHEDGIYGPPTLVVEVLSQDTHRDRILKFTKYLRYGVSEYWIVNPDKNLTEVYTLTEKGVYELYGKYSFEEEINSYNFKNMKVSLKMI